MSVGKDALSARRGRANEMYGASACRCQHQTAPGLHLAAQHVKHEAAIGTGLLLCSAWWACIWCTARRSACLQESPWSAVKHVVYMLMSNFEVECSLDASVCQQYWPGGVNRHQPRSQSTGQVCRCTYGS